MRIRVRGPNGQSAITLPENATVADLRAQITETTAIKEFDLKYSYPPKPLELEKLDASSNLSDIGIKLAGEQLIVSEKVGVATSKASSNQADKPSSEQTGIRRANAPNPQVTVPSTSKTVSFAGRGAAPPMAPKPLPPLSLTRAPPSADAPELPLASHSSTLLLRIMPDDNSCMFRAFNSAFFGAMDNMTELRSIIAQHIQTHAEVYPKVVLEKDPDDYCRWIQTEDAWGGAIELDILSRHFDIEICSIDVQTLRVDRFNEGRPTRCILVYSGIHFDVIALSPSDPPFKSAYAPPEFDTKVFDSVDEEVLQTAVKLCKVLQGQHYFTDTASFSIKCNVCGGLFVGEKGATEHAQQTGHYDFGEAG
ncbi:ubiquitin-specific protease otu1 [Trapelia coarctata]|nr:ubiquitin-specific protease otu1 [Trapelia coarctata]